MTCTVYAVVDIYGTLSSAYTLLFRRHTWYSFVGTLLSRQHTTLSSAYTPFSYFPISFLCYVDCLRIRFSVSHEHPSVVRQHSHMQVLQLIHWTCLFFRTLVPPSGQHFGVTPFLELHMILSPTLPITQSGVYYYNYSCLPC